MSENSLRSAARRIAAALRIKDFRFVEIESKRRVVPEEMADLREFLLSRKRVRHSKAAFFFDQFLDTPDMELFRRGASLRLRYKREGTAVYLQYKGRGFRRGGLLYRSEFATERLTSVLQEESHHDIIRFNETSVAKILAQQKGTPIAEAMERHLGGGVLRRITTGPILSMYQKDKFVVDLGRVFLEPSLDRIFAFHVGRGGVHPLSTFCEYENEVKARRGYEWEKLEHLGELLEFDRRLADSFDMPPEPFDKYHRCASFFVRSGRARSGR
ncbi:MAG: CYTH domain-containing protein [Elusimicrobia bacterium]|nr:CYTH domain-containing protein [Elusimicrobiota bacterium]